MAATKEQQRRYQAALRRVLARFRKTHPETYRQWLDEALDDYDKSGGPDRSAGSARRPGGTGEQFVDDLSRRG